jgi:hypothetical protein
MKFSKILFLMLCFLFIYSSPASSEETSNADFHFLFGYQDMLQKRYGASADHFYQAVKGSTNSTILNRSILYLGLSQSKLGNKNGAAFNAAYVDEDNLTGTDVELFKQLKNFLGSLYTQAHDAKVLATNLNDQINVWVLPYAGTSSYSALSLKDTASFYGVYGLIAKKDWSLSLSGEKFNLSFKDTTPAYTQTQAGFSINKLIGSGNLTLRYTQITSDSTEQSGIKVLGIGLGNWLTESTRFTLDYYNSSYPNSTLGSLTVDEVSTAIEQTFLNTPEYTFWAKLGDQALLAKAASISDKTSFISNKIYNRLFFDLNFRVLQFVSGFSVWQGTEAFGVRNDGNLIYSGTEEHIGGYSANLSYIFNLSSKLQLTYMKEKISIDSIKSESTTLIGMYTYYFN